MYLRHCGGSCGFQSNHRILSSLYINLDLSTSLQQSDINRSSLNVFLSLNLIVHRNYNRDLNIESCKSSFIRETVIN